MTDSKPDEPFLPPHKLQAVHLFLEDFYPNSINAGNQMVVADIGMAQVRGLETLILASNRFSEIINYIKNQTGKDRHRTWIHVGPLLLEQLDQLEKKANELGEGDAAQILWIKLKLAREWAKQVVAHYLFSRAQKDMML